MTHALNLSSSEPLSNGETTTTTLTIVTTTTCSQVELTNGHNHNHSNNSSDVNASSPKKNASKQTELDGDDSDNSSSETEQIKKEDVPKKPNLEFKLLPTSTETTCTTSKKETLISRTVAHSASPIPNIINREKYLINEQANRSSPIHKLPNNQPSAKCNGDNILPKKCVEKTIGLSFSRTIYLCVISICFISIIYKFIGTSVFTDSSANSHVNDLGSTPYDAASLAKQSAYRTKFSEHMKFIKSKYPNQTSLFWANIESTYRHSIVRSKDPAIVLMVSDKNTNQTGQDLASDILNAIKTSTEETQSFHLSNLIISPNDYSDLIKTKQFDQVKLMIDNKLNKIFSNGQRVALVRSIQHVPATAMLLFYTYGDDLLSAKYPGVVILMTLEIDDIIENREEIGKTSKKIMEFVESYLFKMWSQFVGEDQLKPLFTRIGNNVVFVNN